MLSSHHSSQCVNLSTSESNKSSERIKWIDCLRGFSMFFVVYYHIEAIGIRIPVTESVLSTILLSFRMPVFFFISGFIAYKGWQYWTSRFYLERLSKKARIQLIPTIVFFSLWVFIFKRINPINSYISEGLEGFWFTFVLFEFFTVYFTISIISNKLRGKLFNLAVITTSIIAIAILVSYRKENVWWNTLCLTPFFRYLQFFMCGILCRKYQTAFFKLLGKDWFLTVNIIIFISSILLICTSNNIKVEYGIIGQFIHDILVRYAGLFIVLSCFYQHKEYFNKENIITTSLRLLGKRSLDIYMIHNFLLPHLIVLQPILVNQTNIVLEFWILVLITVLVISFALMIGSILRNSKFLTYYLLGGNKHVLNNGL